MPQLVPVPALAEEKSEVNQADIAVARKAARLAAINQAKIELEEEREERSQALKNQLLTQLDGLLLESEAGQAEARTEAQKIEDLRKFLREQIIEKSPAEAKSICDLAFKIQLMLTQQWPVNDSDENGDPIDPVYLVDPILAENRVASAGGYIFDKNMLNEYFKTNNAYQINQETNLIELRNPLGGWFSPREVAHFEASGVVIPERNQNLRNAVNLARSLGQGGAQIDNVLGSSLNLGVSRRLNPILNWLVGSRFFGGFALGMLGGGLVGYALGIFMSLFIVFAAIFTLPPLGFLAVFAVGAVCGLVESRRQHGSGFLSGLNAAVIGGSLAFLAASLGPLVVAGLGAASLISSASVATATAAWTLFQPLVPVAIGALAAVREIFDPGAMKRVFDRIHKVAVAIPAVIGALTFGFVGGLLGLVISIFTPSLRGGGAAQRRPSPVAVPPDARLVDVANEGQPQLSPNARAHQVFGQRQEGEPVSPRTAAAIVAAMQEDEPLSPRTAMLFQRQLVEQNQANRQPVNEVAIQCRR